MPINILMPALSPTMEKGNLAKWHVREGDRVAAGDVIAEIETDKATMEVEAVDEGTMARIVVPEGTTDVPVNELIAVLAGEGEDAASMASSAAPADAGKAPAAPPRKVDETARSDAGPQVEGKAGGAETDARRAATDESAAPARRSDPSAPRPGAAAAGGNGRGRVFASPLARRLAREKGLQLAGIAGSGPHGRIVRRDIEAALETGAGRGAPQAAAPGAAAAAAQPAGMSDEQIRRLFPEGSYEVVPHDSMRRIIARRLTEAKTTIPHFYLTTDCEIDALLRLRADLNEAAPERDGKPAYKLSVNDLIIKALALALQAVPDANVTWTNEGMLRHRRSDVGVAVSIPGGLITPVIREAESKSLSAISGEMKDLAARARNRKLKPEEYQGGTTAISNLGMFGVRDFAAVINPPHATILAVGAGEPRAVVRDDALVARTIMTATLSTDHRAVDGVLGAELLAAFKRYIEKPVAMLA